MSNACLSADFFSRPVLEVAPELIGKYLVRRFGNKEHSFLIADVEAYDGPHDRACHGRFGKTKRTEVMFGPAGRWYVYFCYGVHFMLNIVTGSVGYPAAVLIRGVEGIRGPGKITRALKINQRLNGQRATKEAGLWIEDRGVQLQTFTIKRAPRVGVAYAGVWSEKPYRYILETIPTPDSKSKTKNEKRATKNYSLKRGTGT